MDGRQSGSGLVMIVTQSPLRCRRRSLIHPRSSLPPLAHLCTQDYAALTWSTWLVAVCILWSPFWFNPQTFQLERCVRSLGLACLCGGLRVGRGHGGRNELVGP